MSERDDLIYGIDKIHTTELGYLRLQKNTGIEGDIIEYIKNAIYSFENIIIRKGKNFYLMTEKFIFTINSYSLTVITGHTK